MVLIIATNEVSLCNTVLEQGSYQVLKQISTKINSINTCKQAYQITSKNYIHETLMPFMVVKHAKPRKAPGGS